MIYATTDESGKAALKSSNTPKQYRRIKAIDLSSEGYKVPDIAEILDLSAATVRRSIHIYTGSGLEGLEPKYGKSRGLKLTWPKEAGQELLAQTPASFEALKSEAQNWTRHLPLPQGIP